MSQFHFSILTPHASQIINNSETYFSSFLKNHSSLGNRTTQNNSHKHSHSYPWILQEDDTTSSPLPLELGCCLHKTWQKPPRVCEVYPLPSLCPPSAQPLWMCWLPTRDDEIWQYNNYVNFELAIRVFGSARVGPCVVLHVSMQLPLLVCLQTVWLAWSTRGRCAGSDAAAHWGNRRDKRSKFIQVTPRSMHGTCASHFFNNIDVHVHVDAISHLLRRNGRLSMSSS